MAFVTSKRDVEIALEKAEQEVRRLTVENERLAMTLEGRDKGIRILNAGMESQSEICDSLKQENRKLKELAEKLGGG